MKKILLVSLCIAMLCGCTITDDILKKQKDNREDAVAYLQKDKCYQYHYKQLDHQKQKIYEQIYMGLSKREKKIIVNKADEDEIYNIIELVSYDHPELYDYKGASIYAKKEKIELVVGYNKDERSLKEIDNQLAQTLADVKTRIDKDANAYDITKVVYDYIIEQCEYVEGANNNQNILSSLIDHQTVCAGYAKGIQYLLNKLNIPCTYIVGNIIDPIDGKSSNHAWNMVEIEGDYYYMDATWGDMVEVMPHTCYAYFMMSQTEMLQLYVADVDTQKTVSYDNYFMKNGIYLNGFDTASIGSKMVECYQEGTNIMEIKCSPDAYEDVVYQLTENGEIYNIMDAYGLTYHDISYTTTPKLNLIEIILN